MSVPGGQANQDRAAAAAGLERVGAGRGGRGDQVFRGLARGSGLLVLVVLAGIAISMTVNATSGRQRRSTGPKPPRDSAMGSSTSPPIAVRRNTSVPGGTSRTATRISRYGMPQITHIAVNRAQLRLVTA